MQPETCLRKEQLQSGGGGVWITAGLTRPPHALCDQDKFALHYSPEI